MTSTLRREMSVRIVPIPRANGGQKWTRMAGIGKVGKIVKLNEFE